MRFLDSSYSSHAQHIHQPDAPTMASTAGNQLYAAHCGDTRAVMSRNGEALRLTEDHKPNLPRERKRVEVRSSFAAL